MTREEAIEVRKLTYEDLQKSKRHAFQLNADYGRWLIACDPACKIDPLAGRIGVQN
jgi:hypothetical protein